MGKSRKIWKQKERVLVPIPAAPSAGGGYGGRAWNSNTAYGTSPRRLYRNPEDKMVGGGFSGMLPSRDGDVTLLRMLLPVYLDLGGRDFDYWSYIVCWLGYTGSPPST
ncbi:hypothetical protein BACUNI_02994 [Bacteroides uniformis ATCC 8492]|uniref:Uncharacterized protein n=1 Tax=Bacteroides uniformis (strain ATCC 8492 / DSM 6597 / CCUG 4942 / CIP 103695 / JCM 5828 / KCTC 5204 / NCTC 13054 / VPI 0061) TaxID=411479 RepID=A0ABC9NAA3_BACUC|nr:hypothetical protein BACUNI_02994 [Bacteroides uniformis ATCC 8492]